MSLLASAVAAVNRKETRMVMMRRQTGYRAHGSAMLATVGQLPGPATLVRKKRK